MSPQQRTSLQRSRDAFNKALKYERDGKPELAAKWLDLAIHFERTAS